MKKLIGVNLAWQVTKESEVGTNSPQEIPKSLNDKGSESIEKFYSIQADWDTGGVVGRQLISDNRNVKIKLKKVGDNLIQLRYLENKSKKKILSEL